MLIAVEAGFAWRNRAGTGMYARSLFRAMEKLAPEHTYRYLADPFGSGRAQPGAGKSRLRRLATGLGRMAWLQASLPLQILECRADVFHGPAAVGPFWQPCPTVLTVLDLVLVRHPETADPVWRWYALAALRLALPRAAAVIAISASTCHDVLHHFGLPPDRVHIVHCAHDDSFCVVPDRAGVAAAAAGLGLPERFVLYVGTLEPRKNVPRLLEAFRRLKEEHRLPHKLVLVGEKGWRYDAIFRQVQQLCLEQDVLFTGYLDDAVLPLVYNAAELFVFPSLYEGFGLPVLEAMACGCPVVTANVSSLPEVAADAALCVDPYDVVAIAQAMAAVLTQPDTRADLVRRGLRQASLFSWERAAHETLEVYARIRRPGDRLPTEAK